MALRRAVVVDRDPALLASLTVELGRSGLAVETLESTVGLTPDLIALSAPDLLVIDGGLNGLDLPALMVIVRSMKARMPLRIAISTEQATEGIARRTGADLVVSRSKLKEEGARALGIVPISGSKVDVRAIIDEVLGVQATQAVDAFDVKLDLFSDSRLFVSKDKSAPVGVFIATSVVPPIGHTLNVKLELFSKHTLNAKGEVLWYRSRTGFSARMPPGVGVKLLNLTDEQRGLLDRYLEAREPLLWAP